MKDVAHSNIDEYFEVAADFIATAEESVNPRVLVHCRKGNLLLYSKRCMFPAFSPSLFAFDRPVQVLLTYDSIFHQA